MNRRHERCPGPWKLVLASSDDDTSYLREKAFREGLSAVVLRCRHWTSANIILNAFSDALQFPAYFGDNWNALVDCLRDQSWNPGTRTALILVDPQEAPDQENMILALDIVKDVASAPLMTSHFVEEPRYMSVQVLISKGSSHAAEDLLQQLGVHYRTETYTRE